MTRTILIFGSLLGAILCANMFYMVEKCYNNPYFESNDTLGWIAYALAFSLVFFGIWNYRNKELGGAISFGKAFKTGALIALFACTMYVVVWLFYFYLFVPDFMDRYRLHVFHMLKVKGASASEVVAKTKEIRQYSDMYKNPVWVILLTYMEVLPLGLITALIGALVLKRKD